MNTYPGQQQRVTFERAAVSHHGHDDEKTAHGDDDGMDSWRIREDGCFLQPADTQAESRLFLYLSLCRILINPAARTVSERCRNVSEHGLTQLLPRG